MFGLRIVSGLLVVSLVWFSGFVLCLFYYSPCEDNSVIVFRDDSFCIFVREQDEFSVLRLFKL